MKINTPWLLLKTELWIVTKALWVGWDKQPRPGLSKVILCGLKCIRTKWSGELPMGIRVFWPKWSRLPIYPDKLTLWTSYCLFNICDMPTSLLGMCLSPLLRHLKKKKKSKAKCRYYIKIHFKKWLLSACDPCRTDKYSPAFALQESNLFKP